MPTAQKFISDGEGNGFPFCLTKVDVSGFADTAPMTYSEIMSFYYNIYSMTSFASMTEVSPVFDGDVSNPNIDTRLVDGVDENPVGYQVGDREPIKRACVAVGIGYEAETDGENFNAVRVDFVVPGEIARMYDGVTTDEGNFVGYGFGIESGGEAFPTEIGFSEAGSDTGTVGSRTSVYSWAEEGIPNDWWSDFSVMGTPDTVTETTIGGFPMVKAVWTSFNVGDEATDITSFELYTY